MEDSRCQNCYTCEKGVAPFVTAEMLKEAKEAGNVPEAWYVKQEGAECDSCYDCQKCFSGQRGGQARPKELNYFLFLTNECNLRCTYCYATKKPISMGPDTLLQLKHFLTEDEDRRLGRDRNISIQFFGGEPTLEWSLLRRFVIGFNDINERIYNRKVRWGMTTNCTLLTEERIKFLKEHGIRPLLSIDGREQTHNIHRKTKDGKDSFWMIPLDMILSYFPNPEIRPTITPESIDGWYDDVMWFYSKGCYMIATEVAYEANWTEEKFAVARATYEKLGDLYVQRKKSGQPMWMKFIDDARAAVGMNRQVGPVCGTARNSLAIDAAGLIYACQRYAAFSNPDLNIGNIWDGLNEARLKETQDLLRENMFPDPASGFTCDDCVARWTCRGGCNAMNFQTCGDRKMIMTNHCIFHKMWAEIALKALARTGELFQIKCGHNKIQKVGKGE